MAERLVEGEQELRFVHPLVRSAVYQDLALPVRQRWHHRAARMLHAEGAPLQEVTVHLLAGRRRRPVGGPSMLRQAAADARRRGAPDVAAVCLRRALAEPPAATGRADVLSELGELGDDARIRPPPPPTSAEALAEIGGWPWRGQITLALSEALALGGRFGDAVDLLAKMAAEAGDERSREALQAALLNTARMDIGTRAAARPLLRQLQARAADGKELDPRLHANLAIELAAAGTDRDRAVRNAREALREIPRLMSASTAAFARDDLGAAVRRLRRRSPRGG